MICPPCAYAADTNRPAWHERCESASSCSCQHHDVGYGMPEPAQGPAEETPAPAVVELDAVRREALAATGLTYEELRARVQGWAADGNELMVWGLLKGEAA